MALGIGQAPIGKGPVGIDPSTKPTTPPGAQAPLAAAFDPQAKGLPQLANGLFAAIHPVDQAVVLAISVVAGTIASVPTQGQTFTEIEWVGADIVPRVRDMIETALSKITDRGDATIVSLDVQPLDGGGFAFALTYRNNRAFDTPTATLTISA